MPVARSNKDKSEYFMAENGTLLFSVKPFLTSSTFSFYEIDAINMDVLYVCSM